MLANVLKRRIEWGDCDPAGIVFNPNFFSFFDHGTSMLYEVAGWPKKDMAAIFKIIGCPLVETRATFNAPCIYGDDIVITSSFVEVRKSSFDIKHQLTRGEKLCVEGFETRVWTSLNPETRRLSSTPIPEEVVSRFKGR